MNEFERRKRKVGSGMGKNPERYRIDAAYVLGANPDHPEGRIKLEQLAADPNPRVRAAAEAQLHSQIRDGNDDKDDEPDD